MLDSDHLGTVQFGPSSVGQVRAVVTLERYSTRTRRGGVFCTLVGIPKLTRKGGNVCIFPPLFRHPPTHRSKHGTTSCKDIFASSKFHQLCSGGQWSQTRSGVLPRREQAPMVSESRIELRCTTYTDASTLRHLHTASAPCNPDEWTKLVRKEPAGPGALG